MSRHRQPVYLRLAPEWVQAFQAAADKAGISLNQWLATATATQLPASVRKRLGEWPEFRTGNCGRKPNAERGKTDE